MNTLVTTEKNLASPRSYKALLTDDEAADFQQSTKPAPLIDGLSALIRWFLDQDDIIQGVVMGTIPESLRQDVPLLIIAQKVADKEYREKIRRVLDGIDESDLPAPLPLQQPQTGRTTGQKKNRRAAKKKPNSGE